MILVCVLYHPCTFWVLAIASPSRKTIEFDSPYFPRLRAGRSSLLSRFLNCLAKVPAPGRPTLRWFLARCMRRVIAMHTHLTRRARPWGPVYRSLGRKVTIEKDSGRSGKEVSEPPRRQDGTTAGLPSGGLVNRFCCALRGRRCARDDAAEEQAVDGIERVPVEPAHQTIGREERGLRQHRAAARACGDGELEPRVARQFYLGPQPQQAIGLERLHAPELERIAHLQVVRVAPPAPPPGSECKP
jgi:hypothetical protein